MADFGRMGRSEYLLLLGLCLLVTAPLEVRPRVRVYRQSRRLVLSLGCMGAVFVAWDLLGARLGHWDYNPAYVSGLRLGALPLEEYLFFLVVPLCGIMAYEAVRLTLPSASARLRSRRSEHRRAAR